MRRARIIRSANLSFRLDGISTTRAQEVQRVGQALSNKRFTDIVISYDTDYLTYGELCKGNESDLLSRGTVWPHPTWEQMVYRYNLSLEFNDSSWMGSHRWGKQPLSRPEFFARGASDPMGMVTRKYLEQLVSNLEKSFVDLMRRYEDGADILIITDSAISGILHLIITHKFVPEFASCEGYDVVMNDAGVCKVTREYRFPEKK